MTDKTCLVRGLQHYVINPRWCTREIAREADLGGWTLTHRPTGLDATRQLGSRHAAEKLANLLDRKFGVKAWLFTDPKHVPKEARAVVMRALPRESIFVRLP